VNSKEYNYYVYQFIRDNGGFDNWDMVEIERVNTIDKSDLHKRERFWIDELKSTLNKQLPTRTKKEYEIDNHEKIKEQKKGYRIDNHEKINEQQREIYQNNKEKINEQNKQWRDNNKEKIKEQKKQPIECQCGCMITKSNLPQHKKTQKHKLFIELNNYNNS
jgi:hypothetical protein